MRTAIPSGTELSLAAVTTNNAVVSVELSVAALKVTDIQRTAMLAQIVWTLTNRYATNQVVVTIGGQRMLVDKSAKLQRSDFDSLNPNPKTLVKPLFVVSGGTISRGTFGDLKAIGSMADISAMAISSDGLQIATVRDGVVNLLDSNSLQNSRKVATGIATVDFDAKGRLWLVTTDGRLLIRIGANKPKPVLGLPVKATVVAISNSIDGARIAIVTAAASGRRARLYGVINTSTGVTLSASVRAERFFADVADIDWLSAEELVVVGRVGVEEPQVYVVSANGDAPKLLGGPRNIMQIYAAYDQPILALTAQGLLWSYVAGRWSSAQPAVGANYAG